MEKICDAPPLERARSNQRTSNGATAPGATPELRPPSFWHGVVLPFWIAVVVIVPFSLWTKHKNLDRQWPFLDGQRHLLTVFVVLALLMTTFAIRWFGWNRQPKVHCSPKRTMVWDPTSWSTLACGFGVATAACPWWVLPPDWARSQSSFGGFDTYGIMIVAAFLALGLVVIAVTDRPAWRRLRIAVTGLAGMSVVIFWFLYMQRFSGAQILEPPFLALGLSGALILIAMIDLRT